MCGQTLVKWDVYNHRERKLDESRFSIGYLEVKVLKLNIQTNR